MIDRDDPGCSDALVHGYLSSAKLLDVAKSQEGGAEQVTAGLARDVQGCVGPSSHKDTKVMERLQEVVKEVRP